MLTMEQLMALGLTEEQANKVLESMKASIDGSYVTKDRFNEVNTAKNQLEKDLKDRDKQLEDLKATSGDSEALKKQIETLQADNKAAKEKAENDMKALKLDTAIKLAIAGKVHDEELAAGLFKKEQLVLSDDGKVVGLDEQLKALKETKAFLFKPDGSDKPALGGKERQPYKPPAGETNSESLAKSIAASMNKETSDNPYAKAWD